MQAVAAGRDAWRDTSGAVTTVKLADEYDLRWALATGDPLTTSLRSIMRRMHSRVYVNTRILYSPVPSIVNFYASMIYQGKLSTDGEPLPDGEEEAMPIDAQTGQPGSDTALRRGIAELQSDWNWSELMTLAPLMASSLGDVLTELIDDVERGDVYPSHIWPGYVTDLQLDSKSNVKAYRLDYQVVDYNDDGTERERYLYGKQVDREAFRYYKNGQPFDYGAGSVVENPYGFVPAVWDRHQTGPGERGRPAASAIIPQLMQLNSLLSHALDFQHKAFGMPFVVAGAMLAPGTTNVQVNNRPVTGEDIDAMAESQPWIPGQPGAAILEPKFDIGQTLPFAEFMKAGILDLAPEVRFWSDIRQMSQATGPAVQRAQGDGVALVQRARAGYDVQRVKEFQMALAMAGYRANRAEGGWAARTKRQQAWLPFNLDSFAAGALDFTIKSRDVIPPTDAERLNVITQTEAIRTMWGATKAGLPEDAAKEIVAANSVEANTVAQY